MVICIYDNRCVLWKWSIEKYGNLMTNTNTSVKSPSATTFTWLILPSTKIGCAINAGRQRLVDADIPNAQRTAIRLMLCIIIQTSGSLPNDYQQELTDEQAMLYGQQITHVIMKQPLRIYPTILCSEDPCGRSPQSHNRFSG